MLITPVNLTLTGAHHHHLLTPQSKKLSEIRQERILRTRSGCIVSCAPAT